MAAPTPGTGAGGAFSNYSGSNQTLTFSVTVPAGNDAAIAVVCGGYVDVGMTPTTATYNGVSMGAARVTSARSTDGDVVVGWALALGNLGSPLTANVVITIPSSGAAGANGDGAGIGMTGVDQTTPVATSNSAIGNSTTPSTTLSPTTTDMLIVGAAAHGNNTPPTVGADQTSFYGAGTGGESMRASYETGASTSTTHSYTITTRPWAIAAMALQAPGSGPAAAGQYLTPMRGII